MQIFRPLPLLRNRHVQTLAASLVSLARDPRSETRSVALPDGDRLALEVSIPPGWTPERGAVVLVHGLRGDHRSSYMRRLATKLVRRGVSDALSNLEYSTTVCRAFPLCDLRTGISS